MHRPRWGVALVPLALMCVHDDRKPGTRRASRSDPSPRRSRPTIRSRTWTDTVETAGRRAAAASTATSPSACRAACADHVTAIAVERRAEQQRGRAATSTTATRPPSGWWTRRPAGRSTRWTRRPRWSSYALTSANDAPERDPQRLDAAGLGRRHRLDHGRHPDRPDVRRAVPDQDVRGREPGAVPDLPARHHRAPVRQPHPARRAGAVRRRTSTPPPAGRDAEPDRRRAGQLADRQGGRRLHRAQGVPDRRPAHRPRAAGTRTTRSSTSTSR